ncbi:MAG: YrdB family protein [Kouleothrix sp.]|jgi:hypothetical protein|nr:YrdB family protein [Kouleothrix sp.]
MQALKYANLALSFLLELCALAALGYWGYWAASGLALKIALAIGAPLLMAAVWGLFLAPKATYPLPTAPHLVLQALVFGLATAALYATGRLALAYTFGLAVLISMALAYFWQQ